MNADVELPDRVQQNYRPAGGVSLSSPIGIMGRIYNRFGMGDGTAAPSQEDDNQAGEHADIVDIGIGSYLTIDPGVLQAMTDGMAIGGTHYSRLPTVNPITEAVARKYLEEQGVELDPQRQIHLMGGARVGMTLAILRVLNPGDRVIIPDPDYVGLAHVARGLGAEIVRVPMHRSTTGQFSVDIDAITRTIEQGCRIVMITNPNNPTGHAWSHEELAAIARSVAKVGGVIIANEVYDELLFDDNSHCSALNFLDTANVIVISGTGKAYDMTGIPLGWVAGSADMIRPMPDIAFMYHLPLPSAPALHAGLAALTEPVRSAHPKRGAAILKENLKRSAAVFAKEPRFLFPSVDGGQFAFPWLGLDDIAFCVDLKRIAGVSLMPGSAWGEMGRGHVRLALANKPEIQIEGLARLERGLAKMNLGRYQPIPIQSVPTNG
ncbi:pyridoxal phosphate-dependent aminotransferase [soil metagenome]